MRTFIAIELPQEIKAHLASIQNQLRRSGADVKWVEPKNIHLTLKFLGEIEDKTLDKIICILKELGKDKNSFSARLSSIGAFPKINSPRIIWIGIDDGDTEIKEIAENLEKKIAELDIPAENRTFSSHITIGRVKSGINRQRLVKDLQDLQHNLEKEKYEFLVTRITLFKSTLTPKGSIYETLEEVILKRI